MIDMSLVQKPNINDNAASIDIPKIIATIELPDAGVITDQFPSGQ
jgi:hypothetical protein